MFWRRTTKDERPKPLSAIHYLSSLALRRSSFVVTFIVLWRYWFDDTKVIRWLKAIHHGGVMTSSYITSVAELARLTCRIEQLTEAIHKQTEVFEQLHERLTDLSARTEWYDIQSAQMLRVIATALRQVRETQVYGLLSEGPVSTQALRELLQAAALDPLPTVLENEQCKAKSVK
jgi:hypothetical protein